MYLLTWSLSNCGFLVCSAFDSINSCIKINRYFCLKRMRDWGSRWMALQGRMQQSSGGEENLIHFFIFGILSCLFWNLNLFWRKLKFYWTLFSLLFVTFEHEVIWMYLSSSINELVNTAPSQRYINNEWIGTLPLRSSFILDIRFESCLNVHIIWG